MSELSTNVFTEEQLDSIGGVEITKGKFFETLKQSPKEIRTGIAKQLSEDLDLALRQEIISAKSNVRGCTRQLEKLLLEFIPTQTTTIKIGENFDANSFAKNYIQTKVNLHDSSLVLSATLSSYEELMGKPFNN